MFGKQSTLEIQERLREAVQNSVRRSVFKGHVSGKHSVFVPGDYCINVSDWTWIPICVNFSLSIPINEDVCDLHCLCEIESYEKPCVCYKIETTHTNKAHETLFEIRKL